MENIEQNREVLGETLFQVCQTAATELGQAHLFTHWPEPGQEDEKKISMAEQLQALDSQYVGGLAGYIKNAKKLLEESREGVNPFDGYIPEVPEGVRLSLSPYNQENLEIFQKYEEKGLQMIPYACFVIVAGGLGERLGYSGIKLGLPTNILTNDCYLKLYIESILALQEKARRQTGDKTLQLPLAIMTSGDTHERTVDLLRASNNFGMSEGQVTLMKQEKVPALTDNEAHFAQVEGNLYEIDTKPHGHGDVHSLLWSQGLIEAWAKTERKYVCFLQDTNALVFHALIPALGVSQEKDFVVNSLAVPRRPKEPVGAICKLSPTEGGSKTSSLTINVEYNQLDPLLKATVNKQGDVADPASPGGFSAYPGNINVLIFQIPAFYQTLKLSHGQVPEFVNPKYANEEKTFFKKPTRLECMMQDFPRLLTDVNYKVGFTQFDRFISFSAVKNNIDEAKAKLAATGFAESASSGESDIYSLNRHLMKMAGVNIVADEDKLPRQEFRGISTLLGAKVFLKPNFALTTLDVVKRFPSPTKVKISDNSSLILEGDVTIESLTLDGALYIKASPGAKVIVQDLQVENNGVVFEQVENEEEVLAIRGYKLSGADNFRNITCTSGQLVVNENTKKPGSVKCCC